MTSGGVGEARVPAIFVGHGSPMVALDEVKGAPWRTWGQALGTPRAILVISAHWESTPLALGTVTRRPLIYDFGGFPRALYEVKYSAPGAPELLSRVEALMGPAGCRRAPERGLDHGAWTPLVHLWPEANVPVLQISLPSAMGPEGLFDLGRRLAPLRREGVLILGSGNITHNLRAMGPDGSQPEAWAAELDAWTAGTLANRDFDELVDYGHRAPDFRRNHPTEEHWRPLLVVAGASSTTEEEVSFPVEGFEYQNLSRRAVQFGAA
ncbi:MAG: class III extradiol ring-cleavage dioxygenase [Myxococcota bacterium]|nr:class III extradiol ring-cleavage dioxygenase [Myxococcota bacterium]